MLESRLSIIFTLSWAALTYAVPTRARSQILQLTVEIDAGRIISG
jgi:hypothetical protein